MRIKHIVREVITEIRNLPYNIKNIFGWSRVLWNNFDWDYDFLFEILEYKLKKMKKYFEASRFLDEDGYNKTVSEISISLDACSNLLGDKYKNEIYEKFYDKYPIVSLEEWIDKQGRKVHGMKPMAVEEKKEFRKTYNLVDKTSKELRHQLFDNMRDSIEGWWD